MFQRKTLSIILWLFLCGATLLHAQSTCPTANPVTVVNTGNSGTGSLRWAIDCINTFAPLTTVEFNIPGPLLKVIQPTTPLPGISKSNALIDGTTQSVILDGGSGSAGNGLTLGGSNITVRGLYIRNFLGAAAPTSGISIVSGTGNRIEGNRIANNSIGISTGTGVNSFSIIDNIIGLNAGGGASGNALLGISVGGPPSNAVISGNTIAYTGGAGINALVSGTLLISDNSTYCNTGDGINRTGGPAVPVITQANTQKITGTAASGRVIEVFQHSTTGCTGTIPCQGRTLLGTVTTPASGTWVLNLPTGSLPGGAQVTATSTQNVNNTSEFATCAAAADCSTLNVNMNINNVSCFGGNNGSAMAVPSGGGTAPISYLWNNNATTTTISNLLAGNYTVTVTATSNGCTATQTAVISTPPALSINTSTTNVSCFGGANGSATAAGTGGTPGYSFAWSNGGNTTTITNLTAGTYTVTVTDTKGCIGTQTASVGTPPLLSANISATNVSCFGGANGSATASGTGGAPGYSFTWSNGENTATITNLTAGTYTVTITDGNSCTSTKNTTITAPPALNLTVNSTNETGPNANNGTAQVVVNGGTPGYTYLWSTGAITSQITGLSPGSYTVTVTDAKGCTAQQTANINSFSCAGLDVTISGTNINCNGNANGVATASPTGGAPPYTYNWSNGSTNASITGLAPGAYTVTVSDTQGCTTVELISITQPLALNINISFTSVTAPGAADGTASVAAAGGTPPYNYAWSNGGNTAQITGLTPGTYSVTVTDAQGCLKLGTVTVGSAGGGSCTALPVYALYTPDEVCGNMPFTLEADDLFPNTAVKYVWLLPTGDSLVTTDPSLDLVATSTAFSGNYYVRRDSAGCASIFVGGAPVNVLSLAPGAVSAGNDTVICGAGLVVLKAKAITQGTGTWVSLNGAKVDDPAKNPTSARNLKAGANTFVWTVSLGACPEAGTDTIVYFLENPPSAGDDVYSIQRGQDKAVMEVLLNDAIAGLTDTVLVQLDAPASGQLELLTDTLRFRYTAEEGFRGTVQFRYAVCNPGSLCGYGCDTALVTIKVLNLPVVPEALIVQEPPPNGELKIRNIKGFTRVAITITDRWGDVVFQENAYDNENPWLGDYKRSGRYLPKGAYYYFLKAYDGDEQTGETMTGVIYLFERE